MKKILISLCCIFFLYANVEAIDLGGLESIGPVSSFTRTTTSVTINCKDYSQVRIQMLAPDLVRVRVSFKKALPEG